MHELAVAESIVAAVRDKLADATVRLVRVEVGTLCGVVPEALRFCWDLAVEGTALHGARLDLVPVAGRGRCRDCTAEFDADGFLAQCPCGGLDVEILGGRELRIRTVEVAA